jgi:H+/Cl- antiporter ClcA
MKKACAGFFVPSYAADNMRLFNRDHQPYLIASAFFLSALLIVLLHLTLHPVRVLGMSTSIFYMDEKYTLAAFMTSVTAFLAGFVFVVNAMFHRQIKKRKIIDMVVGTIFLLLHSMNILKCMNMPIR